MIPLYTTSLPSNFFEIFFSFEGARPENLTFFKIFKTKIFIFEYFPKIPSVMNSTHPFYPILIHNTPYIKFRFFFILFVEHFNDLRKLFQLEFVRRFFLLTKKKYFCTGCPKSALRRGKTKFVEFFFFIWASAIKSWEKSRIFRYGLPEDFLSNGQKTTGGGRTPYSAPPPHSLKG